MIVLFTDFGHDGPYVGQLHAVLAARAPGVPVIDLLHSVPSFGVEAGAYLLPAYADAAVFPDGCVFVCVVDPGVGTPRRAVALRADRRWYVAPDNGLLALVARRARAAAWFEIVWRPERTSATFHGRDVFAPVAARLAMGERSDLEFVGDPATLATVRTSRAWPDDCPRIVYLDRYGNAVTGLRATVLSADAQLRIGATTFPRARTFGDVPPGHGLWYENANGFAEIAANGASAAATFGLSLGDTVDVCR